jgi:hypothetical protein
LAYKAKSLGFSAVALEYDDFNNHTRWDNFRSVLHDEGMLAGTWVTDGSNLRHTPANQDFVIAEIEGPGDYHGVYTTIIENAVPKCPRAIISNFWGIIVKREDGTTHIQASAAKAKPLIDAGFYLHTEAYIGESPTLTPENLEFIAVSQLGWDRNKVHPCFGVYGNVTLADYQAWTDMPGWSIYLAEYL